MVEIRYRDQYEVADLTGRSVSDARKLFKNELGIPDKATAKLNGKRVKGNLEADTRLTECDTLSFSRPTGRGPLLIGALLLTLAITGGVFAYTATSTSAQLGVVAQTDFVTVSSNLTDNVTGDTWNIFGKYKGTLPDGNLFTIVPAAGYPGDLVATISLGNGDDMVKAYRVWVMNVEIRDEDDALASSGVLTLSNGEVELAIDVSATNPTGYYVKSTGGFYVSPLWQGFWAANDGAEDPLLYIDVVQR